MDYNITINGFHGTNDKSAVLICESKTYRFNRNENHWLGQGVYFFREDPDQAMSWAMTRVKENEKAVVLKTKIEVNSSSILDLDTRTGIFSFNSILKQIEEVLEENNKGIKIDSGNPEAAHKLRCFIMDALPSNIKVIQKKFDLKKQPNVVLKNSLMETLNIEMHSVQVCVRDQNTIDKKSIGVFKEEIRKPKRSFTLKNEKRTVKKRINYNT